MQEKEKEKEQEAVNDRWSQWSESEQVGLEVMQVQLNIPTMT